MVRGMRCKGDARMSVLNPQISNVCLNLTLDHGTLMVQKEKSLKAIFFIYVFTLCSFIFLLHILVDMNSKISEMNRSKNDRNFRRLN